MTGDRDSLLCLAEEDLARQCRFSAYRSSGPGGQKRNKTSSAVRLVHEPTGLEAHSEDFRSQAENRVRALHRLRFRLAAEVRQAVPLRFWQPPEWLTSYVAGGRLAINAKNPHYCRVAALLLDLVEACGGRYADVASLVGCTTGSLLHVLRQEHAIWDAACRLRKAAGLPPLARR